MTISSSTRQDQGEFDQGSALLGPEPLSKAREKLRS